MDSYIAKIYASIKAYTIFHKKQKVKSSKQRSKNLLF